MLRNNLRCAFHWSLVSALFGLCVDRTFSTLNHLESVDGMAEQTKYPNEASAVSWTCKLVNFHSAPITKFWSNVVRNDHGNRCQTRYHRSGVWVEAGLGFSSKGGLGGNVPRILDWSDWSLPFLLKTRSRFSYNLGQKLWYPWPFFLFCSFTIPLPLHSVCSKCPPLRKIVWGGGGGGTFRKRSRFRYRTRSDDGNIANFPHTFDQDCSYTFIILVSRWSNQWLELIFHTIT